MGAPVSLLQGARALARDFPRDAMPRGYLWDIADFVPLIIDAGLTGRGGWKWGSGAADGDLESGILAPFVAGEQLLTQSSTGQVYRVSQTPPFALTPVGTTTRSIQNPVFLKDTAISPDASGAGPPALWRSGGLAVANALHPHAPVATTYKNMLVTGGAPGEEDVIRLSVPGRDLTVAYPPTDPLWKDNSSYDPNSSYHTASRVTALGALRSALLIFHAGSVERMRGTTPAYYPTGQGDMFLEPLFDRVGCTDPRSIAYWNDNCIFADEHGVHITDGAVLRNLVSQGQILYLWRVAYATKTSLAATTFLDYYLITLRSSAAPPLTLICDLNKRQWFRFTNINSINFIASSGSTGMERVWAGLVGTSRLARIGPCFFPALEVEPMVDDDGSAVLPSFETPWYRIAAEGRKRIRFGYLSYDVRSASAVASDRPAGWREQDEEPPLLLPHGFPALRATVDALQVGYILGPQDDSYVTAGLLPSSLDYTRHRLPVGKFPYGIAFQVKQIAPSTATRIFDLQVEAQMAETSRV